MHVFCSMLILGSFYLILGLRLFFSTLPSRLSAQDPVEICRKLEALATLGDKAGGSGQAQRAHESEALAHRRWGGLLLLM